MIKKLTAKTQELNPKLPQYSSSFSKCLVIKPETQELLLKKGTVYTLFNISGESNFDTELVTKVVNDVIHDFYFQSESISPIQSMEKAIVETKEKVLQLSNDALTSNPQGINLNMINAVLWGNVLYIIQFGNAKSWLMREGGITPLEMISEGNFSTTSKVVDEDEVLILATEYFERSFPPERLLTTTIGENDLDPNQACLLMRLLIDTSFSEDEFIDFGLGQAVSKNRARVRAEKITDVVKNIFDNLGILGKKILGILIALGRMFGHLTSKVVPRRKAILLSRSIGQISGRDGEKTKGWIFLGLISILLASTVFFILRSTVFKNTKKIANESTQEQTTEEKKTEENRDIVVEDKSKDEQYKIKRVTPEVFYDLKITDQSAEPSELEIVGDKLVAADKTSGKLYVSDTTTATFKAGLNTYSGIKSLSTSDDLLTFNDTEGYKTYSIINSSVSNSYKVEGLSLTFPYAGFVYSISSDILSKNTEKDGKLEGVVWAQNPDFVNARSMSIAFSIYILKENGELVNYAGGTKTAFLVSGLEKPFVEPTKVLASTDLTYIYVADRGNKSIVVLDDKGVVTKQYKYDDSNVWNDIRGIAVSIDEKTLFVLNSSKIYKVGLEN
jgi:hypothetical protein